MKKRLVFAGICALSFCLCTAAACESQKEGDESKAPEYSGQHGDSANEQLPPQNDPITLDGVLDEAIYEGQSWLDVVSPGTLKPESTGCRDVAVKATTVYGEEGIYLAVDVSNSFVYVDLDHQRLGFKDSGISLYFADASGVNYEICLVADGFIYVNAGHDVSGMISKSTIKEEVNTPVLGGVCDRVVYSVEFARLRRTAGFVPVGFGRRRFHGRFGGTQRLGVSRRLVERRMGVGERFYLLDVGCGRMAKRSFNHENRKLRHRRGDRCVCPRELSGGR